ncbi:flavin reductase family protein [Aureispira anguillae]|uniref:Flavin reductase family protein n=1 Tax=Aureispira anguillae TaxID=2864201 RepID=A0A915YKS1_9BACT|nr:flavin reductase family protein [Aureispira anguillae]BDS14598.1 flavin reductase family protein [Aureispira anguillae]
MRSIIPGEIETKDLHQFILGAVAPRPIAFVSTIDDKGIANIAPYSFFNAFSSNPPVLVFSSNRRVADNTTKDTLHNVQLNQEVVVNVVNYDIVRQMALASISYPSDISEFAKSGLTPLASDEVKPFRIKESPAHFECKVSEIITLGEHGGAGHLIICNVLKMHVSEAVIDADTNRINPHKIDLVGRMGRSHYVRASGDNIFDLYQSVLKPALGFDELPPHILNSNVLTGNDIAQLAGLYEYPKDELIHELLMTEEIQEVLISSEAPDDTMLDGLHKLAKKALNEGNAERAFGLAMVFEAIG